MALLSPKRRSTTNASTINDSNIPSPRKSDGNHDQRKRLVDVGYWVLWLLSVICYDCKSFYILFTSIREEWKGGWFYFFFPNSGSIFRNAVTMNVMRQHTITMMKNF